MKDESFVGTIIAGGALALAFFGFPSFQDVPATVAQVTHRVRTATLPSVRKIPGHRGFTGWASMAAIA